MPEFDEVGNVVLTKKPQVLNKVKELEKEFEEIVNGKKPVSRIKMILWRIPKGSISVIQFAWIIIYILRLRQSFSYHINIFIY